MVLPALNSLRDILDSHMHSEDDKRPSLNSCLEAVESDALSSAVTSLLEFSESVDVLESAQESAKEQVNELKPKAFRSALEADGPLPYEYRKLKEGEIRIIELLPGTRDNPLHCRLFSTPINEFPVKSEAVSYTWG